MRSPSSLESPPDACLHSWKATCSPPCPSQPIAAPCPGGGVLPLAFTCLRPCQCDAIFPSSSFPPLLCDPGEPCFPCSDHGATLTASTLLLSSSPPPPVLSPPRSRRQKIVLRAGAPSHPSSVSSYPHDPTPPDGASLLVRDTETSSNKERHHPPREPQPTSSTHVSPAM